jgi:hypothetical protein
MSQQQRSQQPFSSRKQEGNATKNQKGATNMAATRTREEEDARVVNAPFESYRVWWREPKEWAGPNPGGKPGDPGFNPRQGEMRESIVCMRPANAETIGKFIALHHKLERVIVLWIDSQTAYSVIQVSGHQSGERFDGSGGPKETFRLAE